MNQQHRSRLPRLRSAAAVLLLAGAGAATAMAPPSAGVSPALPAVPEASGPLGGWVVVTQPVGGPAVPVNQHNSAGGTNSFTRTGTGIYTVRFGGLAATPDAGIPGSGGVVHVTPFGTVAAHCAVKSYDVSGADEVVNVVCVRVSTGLPVDAPVSVTFARPDKTTGGFQGFAIADRPTAKDPYVAATARSLNLVNGVVAAQPKVERRSLGRYFVTFPGAAVGRPDVGQLSLTTVGAGSEACQLAPLSLAAGDLVVGVRCYDDAGTLRDASFALSTVSRAPLAPAASSTYGYHYNTAPTQSPGFNWVSSTRYAGPAYQTVDTPAPTTLAVLLPGASSDAKPGVVHVVAYESADARHCQPRSWRRQLSDVVIDIDCVGSDGRPVHYIGDLVPQPVAVSYQSQKGV